MPDKIEFFLDPEIVIRKRASCKLHKSKSKIIGTQLATVWMFVHNLSVLPEDKAFHDSLVDVQAQTDIVLDPHFVPWIDHEISICPIHKIFGDALTREWENKWNRCAPCINLGPSRPKNPKLNGSRA